MLRFVRLRILHAVGVLLGVSVFVFMLVRVIPGDPARLMLAQAPEEAIVDMRKALGLDRPLYIQYILFVRDALRGNLGTSIRFRRPALELVAERIPATLELVLAAFCIAVLTGFPIGVLSAIKRGTWVDRLARSSVLLGQSVPTYWLGIILILVFAVHWRVFPTSGRDGLVHLILPSVTLSVYFTSYLIRLLRSGMLEVLGAAYIRTGRSKGLPEYRVVLRHALPTALIPVVTIIGLQIGTLLGGAVVTETVFAWPGLGSLILTAIEVRDYPVIQAAVMFSSLALVLINLLIDLLYPLIDPRIRYS